MSLCFPSRHQRFPCFLPPLFPFDDPRPRLRLELEEDRLHERVVFGFLSLDRDGDRSRDAFDGRRAVAFLTGDSGFTDGDRLPLWLRWRRLPRLDPLVGEAGGVRCS